MSLYLTDLADVLRRAGLPVVEVSGWQTRARGSGGYASGRPTHVMWHHTASTTSAQNDVNYQCYGSPDKPIANLYFARDGAVWVMAAGATNTNGKGSDTWGGGVPNDKMNEYAIGCEIGNGGTGEPYPMAQQNAVMTAAKAMAHAYNIPAHKHRAHFEWAPGRKIDPYGPSRWNNDTNTFWDMNRFRNDIEAGGPPPPPPPPEGEENVLVNFVQYKPANKPVEVAVFAQYSGGYKIWVRDGNILNILKLTSGINTVAQVDSNWFEACGPILPGTPLPYPCDAYGRKT